MLRDFQLTRGVARLAAGAGRRGGIVEAPDKTPRVRGATSSMPNIRYS